MFGSDCKVGNLSPTFCIGFQCGVYVALDFPITMVSFCGRALKVHINWYQRSSREMAVMVGWFVWRSTWMHRGKTGLGKVVDHCECSERCLIWHQQWDWCSPNGTRRTLKVKQFLQYDLDQPVCIWGEELEPLESKILDLETTVMEKVEPEKEEKFKKR